MLRLTLLIVMMAAPAMAEQPFASFDAASEQALSNPHDLVLGPDGRLYIADLGNDRVAIMDPVTLAIVGEIGADTLSGPHDVTFDAAGRMLVADTNNNRIAIFEGEALVGELTEGLSRPEGVVEHPNGRVYATGAGNGVVVAFEGTQAVLSISGFRAPHDIEVDAEGNLWFADSGNDRLLQITPDLKIVAGIDEPSYGWSGPRYLDIDEAGDLIVADKYSHRIKRIRINDFRMDGVLGDQAGMGPGLFRTPEGVEIEGSTLWFSDSGNDRIVRYKVVTH